MEVIEELMIPKIQLTKFKKLCDLAEQSDCLYGTRAVEQMKAVIESNMKTLKDEARALTDNYDKSISDAEQLHRTFQISFDRREELLQKYKKIFFKELKTLNNKFNRFQKKLDYIQKKHSVNGVSKFELF